MRSNKIIFSYTSIIQGKKIKNWKTFCLSEQSGTIGAKNVGISHRLKSLEVSMIYMMIIKVCACRIFGQDKDPEWSDLIWRKLFIHILLQHCLQFNTYIYVYIPIPVGILLFYALVFSFYYNFWLFIRSFVLFVWEKRLLEKTPLVEDPECFMIAGFMEATTIIRLRHRVGRRHLSAVWQNLQRK